MCTRPMTGSRNLARSRPQGSRGVPTDGRGGGQNGVAAALKRGGNGSVGARLSLCSRAGAWGSAACPGRGLPTSSVGGGCMHIYL